MSFHPYITSFLFLVSVGDEVSFIFIIIIIIIISIWMV